MTDIVKRLRDPVYTMKPSDERGAMREAADEIDKLRGHILCLRAALWRAQRFIWQSNPPSPGRNSALDDIDITIKGTK